ncbi:uncharacterized protein LOC110745255 [Prunus avium]|uniref:Uncharacterized protein LOC110745255 n=1 Tax=Prunus avium TaxID=42229 RepID=A0A6P5RDJ5_PRUAV|nr:uncharacterized protein LOC110745255 [Prunus avium]
MEKGNPCVWQNLLGIWQITCGKYGGISQSKIPSLNPIIIGGILKISRAGEIVFAARQQRYLISVFYQDWEKKAGHPSFTGLISVFYQEWEKKAGHPSFADFAIYHLSI